MNDPRHARAADIVVHDLIFMVIFVATYVTLNALFHRRGSLPRLHHLVHFRLQLWRRLSPRRRVRPALVSFSVSIIAILIIIASAPISA
ncbi:hypothetical protein B0T22DRAFT_463439 [Podospora appendiculata]|uniref:Uncharacterized protein n=1 Tax=Podospora appendiculata TaxID=314037 RepID=A0AAE0XCU5_9PEZI|nr:hypothetical protein B0T22DRAFT_463439 [Podospora appendiculata]